MECEQAINLASVPDQISAGRGSTYENAILICNVDQMKQIKNNQNKIYRLADNFSLFGYLDSDVPTSFTGQLWGDDYVMFGGDISSTLMQHGLFKVIEDGAKVMNLTMAGFKNASTGYQAQGALAGLNNGLVENVKIFGAHVEGGNGVGVIAGTNGSTGLITRVSVSGMVKGPGMVGGVVGLNNYDSTNDVTGKIYKAKSFVHIVPSGAAGIMAGGIVGKNLGDVRQAMFGGKIIDEGANYFTTVGGIAGKNLNDGGTTSLATIYNSNYSGYGDIRVSYPTNVGGIVGDNQGPVDRTVTEGRITKEAGASIPSTWGSIAGTDSGSAVTSMNYYSIDPFMYLTQVTTLGAACNFNGTDTIVTLSGTSLTAGPAGPNDFLRIDFDESTMIKIDSYTSTTVLVLAGANHCSAVGAGSNFDVYRFESNNTFGTKLTGAAFYDIDSYCSGASLGDKYFTCTNGGFDITEEYQGMDGIGTQRVLDYYMAEMYGQPLPTPPKWVLEPNNNNPPRLFIENND